MRHGHHVVISNRGSVINIKIWTLLNRFINVNETIQSRESSCFIQRTLKIRVSFT